VKDRRWKHPWQVVRFFPNGAAIVCCSHRWEVTAGWCADWRDFLDLLVRPRSGAYYDERRNPYFEAQS
jgi:hypothetical protein